MVTTMLILQGGYKALPHENCSITISLKLHSTERPSKPENSLADEMPIKKNIGITGAFI
jgi:hypothetical protein